MVQFMPYEGVYVIARQYQGRTALTIINGTRRAAAWKANRYVELTQGNSNATKARDVITGQPLDLTKDVPLKARQTLVVEF
jgi:hypothetical protein